MSFRFDNSRAQIGQELGYAETGTTWHTTNTTYGGNSTVAKVPGVLVTVTGQGRPVEVTAHLPSVRTHTANVAIGAYILKDGVIYDAGFVHSASTGNGQQILLSRRTTSLTQGTAFTFELGVYAGSGTTVDVPALIPDFPVTLAVTQR